MVQIAIIQWFLLIPFSDIRKFHSVIFANFIQ